VLKASRANYQPIFAGSKAKTFTVFQVARFPKRKCREFPRGISQLTDTALAFFSFQS